MSGLDMEFDFSSVMAMGRTYENGARIVMDETREGIKRSVMQVTADAKRMVPIDTHTLHRSLQWEVTNSSNSVTGRAGSNLSYAPVVEYGRSAGATMPPPDALAGWLGRHGMDASFAFVVARSIGRRGIRPKPYLKPALDKNRPAITREMSAVIDRIFARLAAGHG